MSQVITLSTWVVLGALGHLGLWVTLFNQMHATAVEHDRKKSYEKLTYAGVALFGLAGLYRALEPSWWAAGLPQRDAWLPPMPEPLSSLMGAYLWLCAGVAILLAGRWLIWKWTLRIPSAFSVRTLALWQPGDVGRDAPSGAASSLGSLEQLSQRWCGDAATQWMSRWPGNQLLELHVTEKVIRVPQLPHDLEGLTIAHASDFHLTGQMTLDYYGWVLDQINALECDLIALTGDLIDKAACLPWLEPLFGRLHARLGVWYVLGNHDCRITDEAGLRETLASAGLQRFHGAWEEIRIGQAALLIAGTEWPWYRGAEPRVGPAEREPQAAESEGTLSVLLSHSPDQVGWAASHGVDLVLAGHTHGGQIRPPGIGPIVSPSRYGAKYASGEFQVGQTLLHVSRGVCGTHAIRLNCRPEITRLRLVREMPADARASAETPRNTA